MIAEKIKNARIQKGYTQEQVAEKLLVSRQTVSNWENGRIWRESIESIDWLYERSITLGSSWFDAFISYFIS